MRRLNRFVITLAALWALLATAAPARAQATALKPDLVVDSITLNPSGNIVVQIRNAGPGPLPDTAYRSTESFAACFVIMIGVQFVDYATFWAADTDRVLRAPGGTISYTSPIRITEPTAVRVWLDITEQVEEANEANNIKTVLLKPDPAK
ncbi:MAG: hypothetical protein HPY67_02705 [Syntrophaceae bacterium]|nr:hypothetical protein [Syntrophaceae bacterium]